MQQDRGRKPFTLAPSIHGTAVSSFLTLLDELSCAGLTDRCMAFKLKYQRDNLLSKYDDSDPKGADDRRLAAISKWRQMELRNARTNVRLFCHDEARFSTNRESGLLSGRIVDVARRTVLRVLGEAPDLEVLYGTFSNGASTGVKRRPDAVAVKFKVGADITEPCLQVFKSIFDTCETWKHYRVESDITPSVVFGGILFTVPKNSEIDRCAVKEPELNMFCQKGVGAFIRRRLKSVLRQDLNDQTVNQNLARMGSIDGSLATLDLSSASDLISDGLVRLLLPDRWFTLLDAIRSQNVNVDGEWVNVNMFSSMGNGFTFELESLLFYAIANAVAYLTGTKGAVSVYGDDIIVPSAIGGLLAKVLQFFGLRVNTAKSFWTGPFRESCGKHWYAGVDVTPFFVRKPINSVQRLIHFLNRLKAWAVLPTHGVCDDSFYQLWKKLSRYVPASLYGGQDLDRIDALVTIHRPRKRLMKVRRLINVDPLGGYLHWLRSADGRESVPVGDPLITSIVVAESERLILRRNVDKGTVNTSFFPSEWVGYGDLDA